MNLKDDKSWTYLKLTIGIACAAWLSASLIHHGMPVYQTQKIVVDKVSTSHNKQSHKRYYVNDYLINDAGTCSHETKMSNLSTLKGQSLDVVMNTRIYEHVVRIQNENNQDISLCP